MDAVGLESITRSVSPNMGPDWLRCLAALVQRSDLISILKEASPRKFFKLKINAFELLINPSLPNENRQGKKRNSSVPLNEGVEGVARVVWGEELSDWRCARTFDTEVRILFETSFFFWLFDSRRGSVGYLNKALNITKKFLICNSKNFSPFSYRLNFLYSFGSEREIIKVLLKILVACLLPQVCLTM